MTGGLSEGMVVAEVTMENPTGEHVVAYGVIENALGDTSQDKSIVAERVRTKLLEQSLIREEHLLAVHVAITGAVASHRDMIARRMSGVSLTQTILNTLRQKQLLK